MTPTDELLTIEEAATYLGLSTNWLRKLRRQGRGPVSWREHGRLAYPRGGLDLYRARQREATTRGGNL